MNEGFKKEGGDVLNGKDRFGGPKTEVGRLAQKFLEELGVKDFPEVEELDALGTEHVSEEEANVLARDFVKKWEEEHREQNEKIA